MIYKCFKDTTSKGTNLVEAINIDDAQRKTNCKAFQAFCCKDDIEITSKRKNIYFTIKAFGDFVFLKDQGIIAKISYIYDKKRYSYVGWDLMIENTIQAYVKTK